SCRLPLARDGRTRQGHDVSNLVLGETAEVPELHDSTLPWIDCHQFLERLIEQEELARARLYDGDAFGEGNLDRRIKTFGRMTSARVIHQDAAHHLSCNA